MYEPWYQCSGPTKEEVITSINNSWFTRQLKCKENSYEENEKLMKQNKITFEMIRIIPGWDIKIKNIVEDEIDKEGKIGFGSYRGFQCFTYSKLCKNIQSRVVRDIWGEYNLSKQLIKIKRAWIEYLFRPGGKGYIQTREHFYMLLT